MTQLKQIIYASDAMLSGIRANAIHVMKMCSALSKYFDSVTLMCHENEKGQQIFKDYGVKETFSIKTGFNKLPKCLSVGLQILLSSFLNALFINRHHNKAFVYARSMFTLLFLSPGIKFIYEVHATPETGIYKLIESIILRRKKLLYLVTISNPLKKKYLELYPFLDEDRILVLHDGADRVSDFSATKELKVLTGYEDTVKIGYIGSLYKGKCMEVLLPIAKQLPSNIFHVIGGNREWIEYWEKEADESGVKNIIFYGMIKPGEVGAYYNTFDICILPYSSNIYVDKDKHMDIGRWISPLKLFEAMSYQKPVVVSDLPSIREVLEDRKDGFLVDSNDINTWVSVIKNLIKSKQLRDRVGNNAKIKLESQYTWDKRAEIIYNKINTCI